MSLRSWTPRRVRAVAATAAVVTALVMTAPGAAAQAPAPGPAPAPAPIGSWPVELVPDGDDAGVRTENGMLQIDPATAAPGASTGSARAQGTLVTARRYLDTAVDRVFAEVSAELPPGTDVLVDIRGLLDDERWTEWIPVEPGRPVDLGTAVRRVQGRLVLLAGDDGASPAVRSLRFTPVPGVHLDPLPLPPPRVTDTFRVFATREGLVGGTTANGHVIRTRDHFAALPSRRGLAPRGTGDYTVKVCADNGRCEWAPVWDVGPWNTTDDYWNDSALRQSWRDLVQGLPQAQAAFQTGYNGGLDQFGRRVANPAGIDLADGTFWDGLGLLDNAWVNVSYLWTFPGPVATVRTGMLNVRTGPARENAVVGLAAEHARLVVECTVAGQLVTGSQGTTDLWLRVGPNQFVSAAHVALQPGATPC